MSWYRCEYGTGGGGGASVTFDYQADVANSWNGTAIGTDDERDIVVITASGDCTISFSPNSTGKTNCSADDGYIAITKNGTAVKTIVLPQNATTSLGSISDVNLSAGDVLKISFGMHNTSTRHTNVNMHLYDGEVTIRGGAEADFTAAYNNTTVTVVATTE